MTEHPQAVVSFPFTAVVGHDDVKLALLLCALDRRIGGVLLRGQKGSAKTTLARALAALLPGDAPFVELPVGATEDRVVGTIDLEAAFGAGRRRFHPGLLAAADNGVLYVDEVNLLPDHLVDVLLDVSASGVNIVERENISEAHPARFVLVGSMNPEEGELRPQLMDRFGLSVEVTASVDPGERAEAVGRRLAHDADPAAFARAWATAQSDLVARLSAVVPATLDHDLVTTVSRMCATLGAEGLRADLVTCRGAAALAGWEGRDHVTPEDVRRVAPLALAHRRRRGPFEDPGIDPGEVDEALDEAIASASPRPGEAGATGNGALGDSSPDEPSSGDRSPGDPSSGEPSSGDPSPGDPSSGDPSSGDPSFGDPSSGNRSPGRGPEPVAAPGSLTRVVPIELASRAGEDGPDGRRSRATGRRGRLIGDRAPSGPVTDVAIGATVRAAAAGSAVRAGPPFVAGEDVREAVREERVGNLVVVAVDASASMGVERRMEGAKAAVMSLLLDAYQRRDRVCLVTFRGEGAEIALRPTGSVEVARNRLAELPTGGRTPLEAGIRTALGVATRDSGTYQPILVLVSDGRATAAPAGLDPLAAAYEAASEVRRRAISSVIVDVEEGTIRLGLAAEIAARMGARYMTPAQLSAGALADAVREAVLG